MEGMTITGVRLTKDARINVLETVLGAGTTYGLGYWGEVLKVRNKDGRVVSFDVIEHEAYEDGKEPRKCRVTTAEVDPAILKMLAEPDKCKCQGIIGQLLLDDMDGPLADCIVQVICFGAVIYG